jgi:hypothetical protein
VLGSNRGEEDLECKDKVAGGAGGRVGVLGHCRALAELHFDFARSSGPSQSAQDYRA